MLQGVRYDNIMRKIAIDAFICLFGPIRILIKSNFMYKLNNLQLLKISYL